MYVAGTGKKQNVLGAKLSYYTRMNLRSATWGWRGSAVSLGKLVSFTKFIYTPTKSRLCLVLMRELVLQQKSPEVVRASTGPSLFIHPGERDGESGAQGGARRRTGDEMQNQKLPEPYGRLFCTTPRPPSISTTGGS